MDFFKDLEEAKQHGIAQEDFVKIWELEMKLKQQKEESRTLELKLAHAANQETSQCQSVIDQVKSVSQDHLKELQRQICELKNDLAQQSSNQLQKLSEQFESQAAVTALVIKNEVENILIQYGIGASSEFFQNKQYTYDSFQKPMAGKTENGIQKSDDLHQQGKLNQDKAPKNTAPQHAYSDGEGNGECLFPSEDGALLCLKDVDQLTSGTVVTESSLYILPDCPSKVRLSMWFSNMGNINARLSVFGVQGQYLKSPRFFTITGFIENKNSGSFSSLFEGVSQPLRKLRPNKEMHVDTTICLKTSKSSYENVTYDELEKRNFVINNCFIIKWFVKSEEVQMDVA